MPTFACLAIVTRVAQSKTTFNQDTKSTSHLIISSGQEYEIKFGNDIMKMLL